MDIHRCRFVPYPPSAINALAFSHSSSLSSTDKGFPTLRLAIGRANGDIEVWNPLKGIWFQESIFRGGKDRSIEGLVWTQDPDDLDKSGQKAPGKLRLFSIGYSTAVTEWDLGLGRPLRHSSGNYGEIWCIAAQPRFPPLENPKSIPLSFTDGEPEVQEQKIVAGCADGAIVLLATSDNDLRFLRLLARPSQKKARVLSVAFQNRNTIFTGHADSTIRVFDIRNGRQIRNMSLGAGPAGGPKEILVWCVRCLSDGLIISGDSTGTVRFWDGENYSLLQRIRGHLADILDVVASADGETVISGGMDRRTTIYRRIGSGQTRDKRRWAEIAHQRLHKHDVKAMATFETKNLSILASGGLDTTPIITPIQAFGREHHRTLPSLPQQPSVGGASSQRLIMSFWGNEIRIWWIPYKERPASDPSADYSTANKTPTRKLVSRIATQGDEALACVDMASNGRTLIAVTMSGTKAFHLRRKRGDCLKISKIELPDALAKSSAQIAKFSPDSKWLLLITPDSHVQLHRIISSQDPRKGAVFKRKAVYLKRLSRDPIKTKCQHGSLGNYDRRIIRAAFSTDSRILAVGDLDGYLDTWVLEGHEDFTQADDEDIDAPDLSASSDDENVDEKVHPNVILGQHWIRNPAASLLPKLSAAPLILAFRPSKGRSNPGMSNGNITLHPTRKTPYPHSHDLPDGENRLFVLTSEHQMYEFAVLSGKLSDWSRRNPTSSLPPAFRTIRDRAMGSVWDVGTAVERIWIHGSSWLWMFDLSKNFPTTESISQSTGDDTGNNIDNASMISRKRRAQDVLGFAESRKHETGAGGKVTPSELQFGIGRKFRKIDGADLGRSRSIDADAEAAQASEDDEAENGSSLTRLRRIGGERDEGASGSAGDMTTSDGGDAGPTHETTVGAARAVGVVPYWGTHKYRDILGMVPLGRGDGHDDGRDDQSRRGVEVALIERPMWDVDLPPRFYGSQEWDE